MAKKVAVYIGRFQPLHIGHEAVLRRALQTYDVVLVLIGSAYQARTIKNPFLYDERKAMLERFELGVEHDAVFRVKPLRDQPYNDAKWAQSVQESVADTLRELSISGDADVLITGSDRDDTTWYLSAFPQWNKDLVTPQPDGSNLCATDLRDRLWTQGADSVWPELSPSTVRIINHFISDLAYRSLVAEYHHIKKYKQDWAAAPYPPTFVAVDAVVIQSGHVLVIKRRALPGKGLWALPGGFLDQKERLQAGCIRELIEETQIKVPEGVLRGSIKAKEIFDHPDRSLRGRMLTVAFLIRLNDTQALPKIKGSDDAINARWVPLDEARSRSEMWFEDHHAILDTMLGMIKD